MRTDGIDTKKNARAPRGRKDFEGQDEVIKTRPLQEKLTELGALKEKADQAREALNTAITAVAKDSGLNSPVVRKFVNAAYGTNFDKERRNVEQLGIVFAEVSVGEISNAQ